MRLRHIFFLCHPSEFFTQLTEAKVLHAKFLRKTENLESAYKRCKLLYSSSSRAISDLLSTFYVKYDQISVALGVALMTAVRFTSNGLRSRNHESVSFRRASFSYAL